MKQILTIIVATVLSLSCARATLAINQTGLSVAIPVGNPVGVTISGTVSGLAGTVVSATVGLNISGGYDANLYSYLVSPNGTMVVLLNHPGSAGDPFGNSGAGMNITLADGGTAITSSSSLATGTYAAAGALSGFTGSAANGTWQLFFADTVNGGGTSVLNGWSLDLTVVPEPVTTALAVFLAMILALTGVKWAWQPERKP